MTIKLSVIQIAFRSDFGELGFRSFGIQTFTVLFFLQEIEDIGVLNDPTFEMDEQHVYETYAYPRLGYDKF